MITRIEIDGFKSFVDFSLDLHPFTAVIGTNASGKSNLLDAFRFLSAAVKGDLYDAVDAVRGDAESLFHQFADGSRVETMRFAVESTPAGQSLQTRHEVEIGWAENDGSRGLRYKIHRVRVGRDGDWYDLRPSTEGDRRSTYVETNDTRRHVGFSLLLEDMVRLRSCQFESDALRKLSRITNKGAMSAQGDGLPGYLNRLRTRTETGDDPRGILRLIGIALSGLIPDVSGFDVLVDDIRRDIRIQFTSRNEPQFEAAVASGGTLRALATLAVLFDPDQSAPILIDEPENGIYPEQFRRLLRTMMDAAEPPRQVLLAGHSPAILDVVPLEQVVVLDVASRVGDGRKSRITRARRASASDAKDSTAHWGPLSEQALKRLRAGEEMPA